MPLPSPKEIRDYVSGNISAFHETRLARLEELKLNKILKRKNPYLFKAKNVLTAEALVRAAERLSPKQWAKACRTTSALSV